MTNQQSEISNHKSIYDFMAIPDACQLGKRVFKKFPIRGGYITQPLATTSKDERPNLRYPIVHEGVEIWPEKQWIWSQDRFQAAYDNDEIVINERNGKYSVRMKQYLRDENEVERLGKPISLLNGPFNQEGTKEIRELFDTPVFDFPKPSSLIRYFFSFVVNDEPEDDGIYLDFFAGSCSSAQALVELNSERFEGQEICRTNFTVMPLKYDPKSPLPGMENELGIGNRLRLLDEDIHGNVKAIQLRNGLAPSETFDSMDFTVEMETGTGKTYVYLRTIFEMNRLYGFTKFIIVVPSVAIKEGVYKSLQMTEEHFKGLYDNVQFDYFVYDSQKLGQVRNFATSDYIQIMVINIDACRKSFTDPDKEDKANIIHRPHDRMTVMANESYEDFARQLQKEIEEEEGIRFGVVEPHLFANIPVPTDDHQTEYLGVDASRKVWDHLKVKGYIDAKGKVQDSLRADLKTRDVDLPEDAQDYAAQITAVLRKVAGNLNIKNADDRKQVKLNNAVFLGQEFKDLWERVKYRTTFRVDFDSEKLIEKCAEEIQKSLVAGRARFITRKARLDVDRGGVQAEAVHESAAVYEARDYHLPDVVGYLQNETNLTRRTLVEIMKRSDRLQDFKNNPQKYIEQVSAIIRHQMRLFIVDGIKYRKLGDQYFYAQELFEENELYGYLSKNMLESKKSVFDHVVYDSDVEEEFARSFELSDEVKVYAKLPGWFKIDTPLGSYNPDWAVLVEMDGQERLYFVVESKGSLFADALRPTEQAKIDCGREHFKALGTDVGFTVANSYETFSDKLSANYSSQGKEID